METSGYIGNAKALYQQGQQLGNPSRERDPNCIENLLKQIEVELSDSHNSAANLADKLRSTPTPSAIAGDRPAPGDIQGRLGDILDRVKRINQELGSAHNAISG